MRKLRSFICLSVLPLVSTLSASAAVETVNIIQTLDENDRVHEGRALDVYQISLKEHQSCKITIQSKEINGLLEIKRPDGAMDGRTKIENGAKPASVEVRARPGEGGIFEVWVSKLKKNAPGRYFIQFTSTEQIVDAILKPDGTLVGEAGMTPEDAEDKPKSSPEKVTIEGVLETGDKTFEDGSLFDAYSFEVQPGQGFAGTIQTHEFDGEFITVDHKGAFSSKAYPRKGSPGTGIEKQIFKGQGGTYQFLVAAKKPGDGGTYTLTLTAPNGKVTGPDGKVIGRGASPSSSSAAGGAAETFVDSSGQVVPLSLGGAAYVDEAVSHDFGGKVPLQSSTDPLLAVGRPDFDARNKTAGFFTLGEKGHAVWKFTDNSLVNGPGDDLVVFEVGQDTEPVKVAISRDGQNWIEVGVTEGGKNAIDLEGKADPGTAYFYVKLTDIEGRAGGRWPGADIDAIAAINGSPAARP